MRVSIFALACAASAAVVNAYTASDIFSASGEILDPVVQDVSALPQLGDAPAPAAAAGAAWFGAPDTNAARFKRGLPPLPPTVRRHHEKRTNPSSVPCNGGCCANAPYFQGYVVATDANTGNFVGFVGKDLNYQNVFGKTNDIAKALIVNLPTSLHYNVPIDLYGANLKDTAHPFFGGVEGSIGSYFASGNYGYAYLSGTGNTDASEPPSAFAGSSIDVLGYCGAVESQIWFLDCQLRLRAQWVNRDETIKQATVLYNKASTSFYMTGDYAAFKEKFGYENTQRIHLSFLPVEEAVQKAPQV